MLKILLFALFSVALFAFTPQTVNANSIPQNEKYNVIFSISTCGKPICKPGDSVKNFSYFIYDNKGSRIKTNYQMSVSQTTIEIKENLPKGDYRFIFFSSDQPLNIHAASDASDIPGFVYAGTNNIYHKAEDVSIGKDVIRKTIELNRISSSLKFDLSKENIPQNVSGVEIHWADNKYVDFKGDSFTSGRKMKYLNLSGNNNLKAINLEAVIFNTSTPFNVSIRYLDKNNQYIAGTEIADVRCYQNQKTLISGTFLNTSPASLKASVSLKELKAKHSVL